MKESILVDKIKKTLESHGIYTVKVWGGGYQTAGVPDIIFCYRGRFHGWECKVKHNTPSQLQLYDLYKIRRANGIGLIINENNFTEALTKLLDNTLTNEWQELPKMRTDVGEILWETN